jgi:multicomponent Na+:H+ antiporter subunit G
MDIFLDDIGYVISWILLLAGSFFALAGGIGVVRLPDFYARLHGGGVTDTLGAGLILAGLMVQAGLSLATLKLLLILFFLLIVSPSSCHALAQSARLQGLEPLLDRSRDGTR